ncbi:MAG TPA: FAD-binding oxidoreductase [Ferruginibacter sp.]|nr:FAD-binding oxidoreductase [Ferruginibacter sp.]
MALEPWRTGKVIRLENVSENTRLFFIQVPELEKFDFKPGQFVTLDLPIHDKLSKRLRSYSIASMPDTTNVFELCIVLLEGGEGTSYLFNDVVVGSELKLRGPVGVFVLPPVIEKDIFLVCTGTGIAPFRSMLHFMAKNPVPHKDINLIFGSRRKINLLYYDELQQLAKEIPGFHYLPTLSREEWEGRSGYVHDIYEQILIEKKFSENGEMKFPPASFYLCGWKNMIDEAKQRILAMGYDRKAIHQELYG